ncbi:MAG: VOC family protein [Mycobacteriales bacterium]
MLLHQVAQHVEDLDRAVAFYRDTLGAELIERFDPPGLAFFRLGETRLLLDAAAPVALLYLRVNDVRKRVASLRVQRVEIVTEPHVIFTDERGLFHDPGTEEWMAFFVDSEGNTVGLASV